MKVTINGLTGTYDKKAIRKLLIAHLSKQEIILPERNLVIPPLGEYWDGQGGVNHGLYLDADGKTRWLLAATEEIEGKWGKYGTLIEGEFSVIDGAHNTELMVNADLSLAKEIRAYSADGHTDFFLGSSGQHHLARANQDKHWKKKWYWTSTQSSSYSAWYQTFDDGYSSINDKDNTGLARPFRSVIL